MKRVDVLVRTIGAVTLACAVSGCSLGRERSGSAENLGKTAEAIGVVGAPLVVGVAPDPLDPNAFAQGEVRLFTVGASNQLSNRFRNGDAVAVGDINNDGLDEIIVGHVPLEPPDPFDQGSIEILNQFGRTIPGFFATVPAFRKGDQLAVGDINNDGFDEIVLGRVPLEPRDPFDDGSVLLFARPGTDLGNFFGAGATPKFLKGDDLAVGDLNGDQFEDILIAHANQDASSTDTGNVEVRTHPSKTFGPYFGSITGPTFRQGSKVTIGDFNNDDFDDLVIAHAAESSASTDTGSFELFTDPSKTITNFLPTVPSGQVFLQGYRLTAGDINGDSVDEVIVGQAAQTSQTTDTGSIVIYAPPASPVTGFFAGATSFHKGDVLAAGTRVTNSILDSDDDGLPDIWETSGIDFDQDGTIDLDLPALNADPLHRDVFVEIDAFACSVAGGDCAAGDTHSHLPLLTDLNPVIAAFAAAPVSNPDGTTGINLHLQIDEIVKHMQVCEFDDTCFDGQKASFFTTAAERAAPNAAAIRGAKSAVFHYSLWTHNLKGGWSGIGEVFGNDFIVSLGNWTGSIGTPLDQQGTFMHELGHNLGLRHGGNDSVNNKPNYLSLMNYSFQLFGIQPGATLDYSRAALPKLTETSLDENVGIQDGALSTFFWCPNGVRATGLGTGAIDWNCTAPSTQTGVSADINNDRLCIGNGKDGILQATAGGDDVVFGGQIQVGANGKLDSILVGAGVRGDDVLSGNTITAGVNGTLETTVAGDDVIGNQLTPGANGQVDGARVGDDVAIQNITAGVDGTLQTVRASDDVLFNNRILPGANNVIDSMRAGDDVTLTVLVLPGPNFTLESLGVGDDAATPFIIAPGANGSIDSDVVSLGLLGDDVVNGNVVNPGADGIIQTIPARDDQLVGRVINDGPNRTCESNVAADDNLVRFPGNVEIADLGGYDDWKNILYQFRGSADFAEGVHSTASEETFTFADFEAVRTKALLADLSITGTVSAATVPPKAPFTYRFTLRNNGPSAASLPALNDRAPAGLKFKSCTTSAGGSCLGGPTFQSASFATLASGQSVTADLVAELDCAAPRGSTVTNTATAEAVSTDPARANNSVSLGVVVGATTPTFEPVRDVSVGVCSTSSSGEQIQLTVPRATDPCLGLLAVTGQVIASDSASVPRTVTNGRVTLPLGTHTVRWSASNGAVTITVNQRVVVRPGTFSDRSIEIRDRARTTNGSGGFATLYNVGNLITRIGVEAHSGTLLSVASVDLRDRSIVTGNLTTQGSLSRGLATTVTGLIRTGTAVTAPPFPTFAGITFPPNGGGNVSIGLNEVVALPNGSYPDTFVNFGGTLVLSSGDYYFSSFTSNTNSTVRINDATGPVRIYVGNNLNYRGPFLRADGSTPLMMVGYNGTNTAVLEAPFTGTVVAPRGTLEMGTATVREFRGVFAAHNLTVRPDVNLMCVSSPQIPF